MEMRLYDGKEYFTRSVSDLLTKMPEPPVKKRKTTRALDQQPSSITQIDEQVDDGGSKPYMCAITPDGLVISCGEFYSVRDFNNDIFLLSKIVEINTNFICTMVLCKANEKGLLCQTEGLELSVACGHVIRCTNTLNTKRTYKREAELFSLSITNPKGCRWRHLIGSLARPNGTCFRVEHSRITSKISSR